MNTPVILAQAFSTFHEHWRPRLAGALNNYDDDTGELFVIPKGVEHITVAENECEALLIELAGTRNTGDVEDPSKTAPTEPAL